MTSRQYNFLAHFLIKEIGNHTVHHTPPSEQTFISHMSEQLGLGQLKQVQGHKRLIYMPQVGIYTHTYATISLGNNTNLGVLNIGWNMEE